MKERKRLKANASNSRAAALKNTVGIREIDSVKEEQGYPSRICHERDDNPRGAVRRRVAAAKRVVVLEDQLVPAREIFSDARSGDAKLTCDDRRVS
jgi:hypothetical protein